MAKTALKKNQVRFALRIPGVLHRRVQKSAAQSRRSINSEMLILMEKALVLEKK